MDEAVSVRYALAWAGDVATQWRRWVRAHLGMTILLSALAFLFGWAWNTYVMAFLLDGSRPRPDESTIATAEGRPFNSLFWLLLFSLLSGLITYGWQRGWRNLFGDLAVLPRRFGEAMSSNTGGAFAMLLWGVSVSLIISTVITSAVSLALGLVLLTLAATPIGTILNFTVIRLWRALAGIAAPSGGMGAVLTAGPFLVMVGEAAGLLLDWLFNTWFIGLIAGIVAAVASILLARGAGPSPSRGSAAGILIGLVVALSTLVSGRAWGDDGGWLECQTADGQFCSELGLGGIFAWFGSEGAGVVLAHSAVGGAFAAAGTAIGVGLGSVAAGLAVAGAGAAIGLAQPPPTKATGHAKVPQQYPQQSPPPSPYQQPGPPGQAGQQIPQQGGPPQGVPTEWSGWQQGAPGQAPQPGAPGQAPQPGIPHQGGPQQGLPAEWGWQQDPPDEPGQPGQQIPPGQQGIPQQGIPQQGGPPQGVPTEWGWQQGPPEQPGQEGPPGQQGQEGPPGQQGQQGIPQQGGPPEWGGQQIVEPPGPTQQGAGWQPGGLDEPTIPQQPTIPIDDVLPEPPDRKRDKDDGRDTGT